MVNIKNDKGKSARHDVVMQEKTRLLKERQLPRWAEWKTADRPSLLVLVMQTCSQWLAVALRTAGHQRGWRQPDR